MNNTYYTRNILFFMRDFISNIIGKYLEYVKENKPEKYIFYFEVLNDFSKFLYIVTVENLEK